MNKDQCKKCVLKNTIIKVCVRCFDGVLGPQRLASLTCWCLCISKVPGSNALDEVEALEGRHVSSK